MRIKNLIIAIAMVLAAAPAFAQVRSIQVFSGGERIYNVPVSGTNDITFSSGIATFVHDTNTWNTIISSIDSLTFGIWQEEDSTQTPDTATAIYITWNDTVVSIINPFPDSSVAVTAKGGDVTAISKIDSADIPYVLRGSSKSGSFTLTTAKKVLLYLENLSLTSTSTIPPIYITTGKKTTVILSGTSTVADNSSNKQKGAFQSKGNFLFKGDGVLNVYGYSKHGIQSSEETVISSGTVNVLAAAKDGLNVDCFSMTGGVLNVSGTSGDGLDGDQGAINISGGTVSVVCTSDDVKGIGCDSTLTISGGTVNVTVSGKQSKAVKSKENIFISGGGIILNAEGTIELEEVGSGYDPSYCTGIKAGGNLNVSGGTIFVTCPSTNAGGHAISVDGDITVSDGKLTLTATGSCATYTDTSGVTDSYKSTCLKSDRNIIVSGGSISATAGGRAISADSNFIQTGGFISTSTSAAGFTIIGTGTSCTDGFAPSCLKADGNITLTAGVFSGSSTGKGGRGISCDGTCTIGKKGAADSLLFVYITTSGAQVNAVSGGGFGGGGSTDYWKGLPKGFKIDGNIIINSGYVQSYCSQSSGESNGEAIESKDSLFINGGYVETNAYDDAINASNYLEINGGMVWAYSRGNDAIDCNGTSMRIKGGTVIAIGKECGLDDNSDHGGKLYISGGTMIAAGGTGGFGGGIEGTPSVTNQKYLSIGSSGGFPGGGGGTSVNVTNGICIKNSSGTEVFTFKAPTVSGSGFLYPVPSMSAMAVSSILEGPGGSTGKIVISSPSIQSGNYYYFTSPTISGGTNWHGLYSGASVSTTGSGTTVTAK